MASCRTFVQALTRAFQCEANPDTDEESSDEGSKSNASKGGKSRNEEDSGEESASSSGSSSDSEEDSSPQTTGDSNNTDEDDELKKIQQSIMDDGNAAIDNLVETDVEYAHQADQTKGMTDKVRHMDKTLEHTEQQLDEMDSYAAWFTAFGNHTDPPPRKDGDEEVDVKMQKEWSFTKNLLGGDHSYVVRFSDKILRLNSKNKLKEAIPFENVAAIEVKPKSVIVTFEGEADDEDEQGEEDDKSSEWDLKMDEQKEIQFLVEQFAGRRKAVTNKDNLPVTFSGGAKKFKAIKEGLKASDLRKTFKIKRFGLKNGKKMSADDLNQSVLDQLDTMADLSEDIGHKIDESTGDLNKLNDAMKNTTQTVKKQNDKMDGMLETGL